MLMAVGYGLPVETKAMGEFVEILQENPLAAGFGMMGLLCQLIWPMLRARRAIMTAQFGIGADYSMQYALLGAWSGAGVAGLGACQSALTFFAGERPWLRKTGVVFLPIVAAICYATWCGIASAFALTAVTLIMIGRMQGDTLRLRIFLLAAAPFGMGYDIVVGALPGLIGAIVSACIAASMLVREIKQRRETASSEPSARNNEVQLILAKGAPSHA
jgi:Bacterial inner membrane protein